MTRRHRAVGTATHRAFQRGLSLVEMMVGIAVGLFIVAGATLVVTTQLGDNRRLLVETQLQQDLRASGDIITRELRRAGSRGGIGPKIIWTPGSQAEQSPYTDITISDSGSEISYKYWRNTTDGPGGAWGFKLDGGVIMTVAGTGWQALTDSNTMEVTQFNIQEVDSTSEVFPCPRGCGGDPTDTSCWPTVSVRSYEVTIAAQAKTDASVQRTVRTQVRVRNDAVIFNNTPTAVCPT